MDTREQTEQKRSNAAATKPRHPDRYAGVSPIQVSKLGHLVYEVTDMERSVRFWTDVMGFHVTDRNEIGMVFLRCGADHHAIGLKPTKTKTHRDMEGGLQVEHLALEIADIDMLRRARDYLKANGIPIVFEGRKGAGCNYAVNFLDPDGYEFEIYCGMDQIDSSGRLRPATQFIRANNLEDALANPVPAVW